MEKYYWLNFEYIDPISMERKREIIYQFNNRQDYDFAFYKIAATYVGYVNNIKGEKTLSCYTKMNNEFGNEYYTITIEYSPNKMNDYAVKMTDLHLKILKGIFETMHEQKDNEELFISLGGLDKIEDTIGSFNNLNDYSYSRIPGHEVIDYTIPYYDEVKDEYDFIKFKIKYTKYLIFKK